MIESFIESYYNFFDKKLNDSTIVVVIISFLVLSVGVFVPNNSKTSYYKANLLESNNKTKVNIITIDEKKYKLILEEIK